MKKLILLLFVLTFIPIASAQTKLELGSTKASIDGMNIILPEAVHIKNGIGMAPFRLLLIESGKKLLPLAPEKVGANYPENIDKSEIDTAFDRFEKPYLILNTDGSYFGTIGIGSNLYKVSNNISYFHQKTFIKEGVLFAPLRESCKFLNLSLETREGVFIITRIPEPKPQRKWTDWLLERISLETLLLICFGIVAFFIILFFILTPLRRARAIRG